MSERLIPESELRQAVKVILSEMLGVSGHGQGHPQQQWYSPDEAAEMLGLTSREQLHKLRLSGDLKHGKHWRQCNRANSKVPRYQYHVENCEKALGKI